MTNLIFRQIKRTVTEQRFVAYSPKIKQLRSFVAFFLWGVKPCSLVYKYRRFGGTSCLCFHSSIGTLVFYSQTKRRHFPEDSNLQQAARLKVIFLCQSSRCVFLIQIRYKISVKTHQFIIQNTILGRHVSALF